MILDISKNGKLSLEQTKLLNQVALEIRPEYNQAIASIITAPESIYQWAMPLISRNTIEHSHQLFPSLAHLALIERLIQQSVALTEIITDSRTLANILKNTPFIRQNNIHIRYKKKTWWQQIKHFWYFRLEYFSAAFEILKRYIITKLVPATLPLPTTNLTLLEVFILHNSFKNNQYQDRYYANFGGYVSSEEEKKILYLPNFIAKSNISLIRRIRQTQKFLLKEDFLSWRDYIHILSYPFRKPKIPATPILFRGYDVLPLFQEENQREWGTHSALNAILNYYFLKRLTNSQIEIKLLINWFENQAISKTLNYGLQQFKSQIPTKGYQVSILDNKYYLCFYPTTQEKNQGLLPSKLAISGKAFTTASLEFCPDLPYEIAPAFRHQKVWEQRTQYPNNQKLTILLGLPIIIEDSLQLIKVVDEITNLRGFSKLQVNIKPHPSVPEHTLRHNYGQLKDNFHFVKGDFHHAIETSHLLITVASSIAVEAIAKGIPVIILGKLSGLTHNPVPSEITQKIWRLCYTPEALKDAIDYFMNLSSEQQKELQEIGKQVRADYFEPVTREATRKFLMLDN